MPNVYCDIAIPGLTALANGVAAGNGQQITQGLDILLGLSPGLTPSGDDVVCGILYVLLRSDARRQAGIRMLADTVQRDAPVKTSTISAAYLTAIAKGEDYERMQDVWLEMTGSGISRVNRLLEVGSCSGGDMLLGITTMSIDFAGVGNCAYQAWGFLESHCNEHLQIQITTPSRLIVRQSTASEVHYIGDSNEIIYDSEYEGGPFYSDPTIAKVMQIENCFVKCDQLNLQILSGQCTLYIGDGEGSEAGCIETLKMEPNRLYNVKKGVWHNLSGSEDMVLLIVENADTSKSNSDFCPITTDMLPED